MTRYLLDTNHCSKILKGDPNVIQRLGESHVAHVVTSVIVCGELFFMAYKSAQREHNLQNVKNLLSRFTIYDVDTGVADWYGTLKAALLERFGPKEKSQKRRAKIESIGITENDLWIAATAQRYACTIVTADRDFQRISEVTPLHLECWL